jgi:hypothetical protein
LMQASQRLWISYSEKYREGSLPRLITCRQRSFHIRWAVSDTRIRYSQSAPLSRFPFASSTSAKPHARMRPREISGHWYPFSSHSFLARFQRISRLGASHWVRTWCRLSSSWQCWHSAQYSKFGIFL